METTKLVERSARTISKTDVFGTRLMLECPQTSERKWQSRSDEATRDGPADVPRWSRSGWAIDDRPLGSGGFRGSQLLGILGCERLLQLDRGVVDVELGDRAVARTADGAYPA